MVIASKMANMEEILAHLLLPDNDTILKATEALKEAFKSAEAIPALCSVLQISQSPQIRQYAAVVLRKRLCKAKNWNKINPDVRNSVKQGILTIAVNEKEKSVKQAVIQFIAAIAKLEMKGGKWPELVALLQTLITSQNSTDVELGLFTMSVLTDVSLDIFSHQPELIYNILNHTFSSLDNLNTVAGYYFVLTMTRTVDICDTEPQLRQLFSKAIPKVMTALPGLVEADEERASEAMELFSEILTSEVPLLTPHMLPFVQLCLEISGNKSLDPLIREKALLLIGVSCRAKKKIITKLQLVKPMVEVLFRIMCERPENGDDEEDDWFSGEDSDSPFQNATQVLGTLSIYLPPNKLLEHVSQLVELGLKEEDKYVKKACYLALATVTEGASECIRNSYLPQFLAHISNGITDHSSLVRNAALFALGQLSEHLQPEISEHHEQLMPILFEFLAQLCRRLEKDSKEPPGLFSMFYALEAFCENLEEKLVPYLPMLMESLLLVLEPKNSVNVQELTLSTIGSVATAVKADLLPYFPKIIEKLNMYLLQQHTEETECLLVQAIQTLSLIARTLGAEHFAPLAQETVKLGLDLLQSSEDPDLKRSLYSLFGAISFVMKEEAAVFYPTVIEAIVFSLKSTEGVVPRYKEEDAAFQLYDDLSDTADEEDIEAESQASYDEPLEFSVENPYMDEKEEACLTLKEFALNSGATFLPYLERCFDEVWKLTTYPHDDVRKSSFETLAQFCVSFSKIETPEGKQALMKALSMVVPICIEKAAKDDEYIVVNSVMEALASMLKDIGPPVLDGSGYRDGVIKCVLDILLKKTECQDKDEDEGDEEEAEQDELLLESAGEVIPNLGKALPAADFVTVLQTLFPAILPKLSNQNSVSQRSFFIGTLAECMEPAGPILEQREELSLQLLQLFIPLAQDSHHEVRNNSIYGLGELVLRAKQTLFSKYMEILALLSAVLAKEKHAGVIDNICGAIAKLIITNVQLIPMDQVFPALMDKLPLREDFQENDAVMQCFGVLYQIGHASLRNQISDVIKVCCSIIHEKQGSEDVVKMACQLVKNCSKDFPGELNGFLQSLPTEAATSISNSFLSS